MKRILFVVALLAMAVPAFAQEPKTSLLDPSRLSIGLNLGREWIQQKQDSQGFVQDWNVGLPMAWEITSPKDTQFPFSLYFRPSFSLEHHVVEYRAGGTFLLKRAKS